MWTTLCMYSMHYYQELLRMCVILSRMISCYKLPLLVESVHTLGWNTIDVTKEYMTHTNFSTTDDLVKIVWYHKDKKYIYVAHTAKCTFPPYSHEELRSPKPSLKILSISVNGNTEYFDELKMCAGPYHNFYSLDFDVGSYLNMEEPTVEILDSHGILHAYDNGIVNFPPKDENDTSKK
jgi:hypothetical protein